MLYFETLKNIRLHQVRMRQKPFYQRIIRLLICLNEVGTVYAVTIVRTYFLFSL